MTISAILRSPIPGATKLLLIGILERTYSGDMPATANLATALSTSERGVQRRVKAAIDQGYLTVTAGRFAIHLPDSFVADSIDAPDSFVASDDSFDANSAALPSRVGAVIDPLPPDPTPESTPLGVLDRGSATDDLSPAINPHRTPAREGPLRFVGRTTEPAGPLTEPETSAYAELLLDELVHVYREHPRTIHYRQVLVRDRRYAGEIRQKAEGLAAAFGRDLPLDVLPKLAEIAAAETIGNVWSLWFSLCGSERARRAEAPPPRAELKLSPLPQTPWRDTFYSAKRLAQVEAERARMVARP